MSPFLFLTTFEPDPLSCRKCPLTGNQTELTMKVLLFSDLHANLTALHQLRKVIRREMPDEIIFLGDAATLGPSPSETTALLLETASRFILGNHDGYLSDPALAETYTHEPVILDSIRWTVSQLSAESLARIAGFLPELTLETGRKSELVCFHGSPRSNEAVILAETPGSELQPVLPQSPGRVFAGGHTHLQMIRDVAGSLLINPGSAGQPFEGFTANGPPNLIPEIHFAVLQVEPDETRATLHRIPLDIPAFRKELVASRFPLKNWMLSFYS